MPFLSNFFCQFILVNYNHFSSTHELFYSTITVGFYFLIVLSESVSRWWTSRHSWCVWTLRSTSTSPWTHRTAVEGPDESSERMRRRALREEKKRRMKIKKCSPLCCVYLHWTLIHHVDLFIEFTQYNKKIFVESTLFSFYLFCLCTFLFLPNLIIFVAYFSKFWTKAIFLPLWTKYP